MSRFQKPNYIKNFGQKTGIKAPSSAVIDIQCKICKIPLTNHLFSKTLSFYALFFWSHYQKFYVSKNHQTTDIFDLLLNFFAKYPYFWRQSDIFASAAKKCFTWLDLLLDLQNMFLIFVRIMILIVLKFKSSKFASKLKKKYLFPYCTFTRQVQYECFFKWRMVFNFGTWTMEDY